MSEPIFYSDGDTPRRMASELVTTQKILGATLAAGSGGSTSTDAVTNGHGAPASAPADPAAAALYTDLTTGIIYTWPAGGPAWV